MRGTALKVRNPGAVRGRPLLGFEDALQLTVDWYQALQNHADMYEITIAQIEQAIRVGPDSLRHCGAIKSAVD
jgi:hypothetical protein